MTFTQLSSPFINKFGTFNQTAGEQEQNTNNPLIYTATYYQVKHEAGELTAEDKVNAEKSIRLYYREGYPGLLTRRPGEYTEKQSQDEYEGVFAICSLFKLDALALEILRRCIGSNWNLDNVNPDKIDKDDILLKNYYGRHFGFIAHAYYSLRVITPSMFERARWVVGVLGSAYSSSGTSDIIRTWHMIKNYERSTKRFTISDYAVKIWKQRLAKKYPNLMGDVFAEYYQNDGGVNHPFAVYMKGKI